jgi:hypothetical protein
MGHPSMLKIFCVVCLLGLSATTALVGDAAQTNAQSSTDQDLVNLVQEGRQLSKANVKQLESALKSFSMHLPTRARLLGFYFHSSLPIFGRTTTIKARRRHILWLIENHPDSSVAGLPEASIEPSGHKLADEEGYQQARDLWLKQVEKNKNNEKVRLNAAKFVQLPEKAVAEPLLNKAQVPNQLEQATSSEADLEAGREAFNRGDFATALEELRPLAEQGDVTAQIALGALYSKGLGVPQDFTEAAKWIHLAAEQGDVTAQFLLGMHYENNWGVPQDYVVAHKWFNLAAEQGHESARSHRDEIVKTMTPAQMAEAQRLARQWMAEHD